MSNSISNSVASHIGSTGITVAKSLAMEGKIVMAESKQSGKVLAPAVHFDPNEMAAKLSEAIKRLNEDMKKLGRNLHFSYDDVINSAVITVRATDTGQVVRQIPNETFIKVAHSIEELKGILLNERS